MSSPTIQKILKRHGMSTRYERWLKLEEKVQGKEIELTPEQAAWLEKQNPCFRERHVESSEPPRLFRRVFHVSPATRARPSCL